MRVFEGGSNRIKPRSTSRSRMDGVARSVPSGGNEQSSMTASNNERRRMG